MLRQNMLWPGKENAKKLRDFFQSAIIHLLKENPGREPKNSYNGVVLRKMM